MVVHQGRPRHPERIRADRHQQVERDQLAHRPAPNRDPHDLARARLAQLDERDSQNARSGVRRGRREQHVARQRTGRVIGRRGGRRLALAENPPPVVAQFQIPRIIGAPDRLDHAGRRVGVGGHAQGQAAGVGRDAGDAQGDPVQGRRRPARSGCRQRGLARRGDRDADRPLAQRGRPRHPHRDRARPARERGERPLDRVAEGCARRRAVYQQALRRAA